MALSTGGGRRQRFHSAPFTEINVTPFVDVMLVLLVIFMVTAPMMTAGVNVDLPQAKAKPLPGTDEPLSIAVTSSGKVYINKTEIPVEELRTKLIAVTGENKDARIFVRGDQSVDYGRIMKVVGEINAAGYAKVSLITTAETPMTAARGR